MGDTFTWKNPGTGGAFNTASDWVDVSNTSETGLLAPGSADIADLIGSTSSTAQVITGPGTAAILNFLGLNEISGSFDAGVADVDGVAGSAALTVAGSLATSGTLIVGNVGNGEMTVGTGAAVTASSATGAGQLIIGDEGSGAGAVTVLDAGVLTLAGPAQDANYGVAVGDAGAGSLVVSGVGSMVTDSNNNGIVAGFSANSSGVILIENGATANFGSNASNTLSAIAIARAGTGTLTVDGDTTQLNANGGIYVGRGGDGTLVVSDSAVLSETAAQTYVDIGVGSGGDNNHVGGNGSATIESDATLSDAGYLHIGGDGVNGQMTVESAGFVSVVATPSSDSTTGFTGVVLGIAATIDGTPELGSGSLEIDADSTFRVGGPAAPGLAGMSIGSAAGTSGTVTVQGDFAVLNTGSNLIDVGNAGTGALNVTDGGDVVTDSPGSTFPALIIGNSASGVGVVTLSGSGSTIDASGAVVVGVSGSGALQISAGGVLTAQEVLLSVFGGSSGTVDVTGLGSVLTAASSLEVGGGASVATLSVENGAVATGGVVSVGIGDAVALNAGTLASTGTITLVGGALLSGNGAVAGTIANSGTVTATGGTLMLAGPAGGGNFDIGAGGVLAFAGGVSGGDVTFAGGSSLDILLPQSFGALIVGFTGGDTIVVTGATQLGSVGPNVATLENAGGTSIGTLDFLSPLSGSLVDNDGTITLACFAEGTRIATPDGDAPVETLRAGDMVLTAAGAPARVTWLGHRRVACARHPRPADVWPVRVSAHAFGPGQPARDLWLSPDHAVFLDGVLIPVRLLADGDGIAQQPRASITYFHVELARHDILLAEGLPCESYLTAGSRAAFENGGEAVQLHPDFAARAWDADACAPLVLEGPRLARARAALARRRRRA